MASEQFSSWSQATLGRRIWWLVFGRAAAVILILLVGAIWKWSTPGVAFIKSGATVTPLILAVIVLSAAAALTRLVWQRFLAQAWLQCFFAVLIVTRLVWIGGIAASPYAALYIVIIAVAGFFV